MQQYDPITINRMIELLPEIERRKRKAKRYRSEQERGAAMQDRPTSGNYVPSQQGGWFPTIQQYQKDYEKAGNQIVGSLTDFLMGRKADREESELASMQGAESLRALDQIQRDRTSKGAISDGGGATEFALRGYLGMMGNATDVGKLDPVEKVRSRVELANGNLGLVRDSGIEDTGMPYNYSVKPMVGRDGTVFGVGTSGAGRNRAEMTMVGGPPAGGYAPPGAPEPSAGPAEVNIDGIKGLDPEQRQALQSAMSKLPEEDAISLLSTFMGLPRQQGGGVASGVQQPAPAATPLRVATKGQDAFDAEQGKISAQLGAADQVTQMEVNREGAKRRAVVEADRVAEIRKTLPKLEQNVAAAEATITKLLEHPGLKNITGRLGGMVPDPDTHPNVYQAFKSAAAGTATGNALALHEQLRGQVFSVAFETLKGGGQITQVEGQKATEAAGRMTRAQTTEAYRQAAMDFIKAYRDGLEKLRMAGQTGYFDMPEAPAAPSSAAGDPRAALRSKYGL